jgi:hypothetical protein
MIFLTEEIQRARAELEADLLAISLPPTHANNVDLLVQKADAVIAASRLVALAPEWHGHYRMVIRDFFGITPFKKESPEYYAAMEDLASLLQLWAQNPSSRELQNQITRGLERLGIIVSQP